MIGKSFKAQQTDPCPFGCFNETSSLPLCLAQTVSVDAEGAFFDCFRHLKGKRRTVEASVAVVSQTLVQGIIGKKFKHRDIDFCNTDPFQQVIVDQNGRLRNDGKQGLSPEELMYMDWLCDNVEGRIPAFEELLPMSQNMVRLLGLYRDELPPEKEGVIL